MAEETRRGNGPAWVRGPRRRVLLQLCVLTAVVLYAFVALLAICAGIAHDRHRPLSIAGVALFMVFGWLYVVLHFTLHTIAFIKVFTGRVGGWKVTERSIKGTSPPVVGTGTLAEPLLGQREQVRVDVS